MQKKGPSTQYRQSDRYSDDNEKHRINEQITVPEVRLILDSGEQKGVLSIRKALEIAEEAGLDLVEVAPDAKPPVCKLIDYGKLKYREQKKAAEARRKTVIQEVKEIRVRYNTDEHDLETKIRNAIRFIGEGDKVRFSMRFRGRESMYNELGHEIFNTLEEKLQDHAVLEERAPLTNQKMHVTFAPKGK